MEKIIDFFRHGGKHNESSVLETTTQVVTTVRDLEPHELPDTEAGAIAGTVFAIVACTVFIAIAGVFYLRIKRRMTAEHNRQAKILKMSAQSAGVYKETTDSMDFSRDPKRLGTYKNLISKNSNLYESDSEEELWLSNRER